jgi:hypothetical protein
MGYPQHRLVSVLNHIDELKKFKPHFADEELEIIVNSIEIIDRMRHDHVTISYSDSISLNRCNSK